MQRKNSKDTALNSEKYTYKPISRFYSNVNNAFTIEGFVYEFPRMQFNVNSL